MVQVKANPGGAPKVIENLKKVQAIAKQAGATSARVFQVSADPAAPAIAIAIESADWETYGSVSAAVQSSPIFQAIQADPNPGGQIIFQSLAVEVA